MLKNFDVRKGHLTICPACYRIVDENEKKEIGMPAGFREQDLVGLNFIL